LSAAAATTAPVSLVVFDFDGTLIDSQHTVAGAYAAAFTACGLPAPSLAEVRQVIGLSLPVAVAELRPDLGTDVIEAVVAAYRQAYFDRSLGPGHVDPLFDGARRALRTLEAAGLLLGIATGKSQRGLLAALDAHDLRRHFVTLQTADHHPSKPHPAMLQQAIAEAGATPAQTVLVGDTAFDMAMTVNAGATALGVAWGYHGADELTAAGAAAVCDSFDDVVAGCGA